MTAMVRRALILALVLASSGFTAEQLSKREEDKARQTWMGGYLKLESAAQAAQGKKLLFALELYEEALAAFQEVQVRYPTWKPEVVNYRIDYTTGKVRELRLAVEVDAEKMSRPDLISTVTHLRKQRASAEAVQEKLKADLKAAQQDLDTLRSQTAGLATAQAEAASLRQTNESLTAEKTALATQVAELTQAQTAAKAEQQEALAALKAENQQALAAVKAEMEQAVTAAKAEKDGAVADLKAEMAKALAAAAADKEQALAASKAGLEKSAADELAKLQDKLSAAESEAAEARDLKKTLAQKTKDAEKAASEAGDLKKDLAKLQGELVAARDEAASLKGQVKTLGDAKSSAETASAALASSQAEHQALVAKFDALAKAASDLRTSDADKATQIAALTVSKQTLDAQLAQATQLAADHATALAKANADVAERDGKLKKLETLIEQTDAYEIDKLATQAHTATAELKKAQDRLAQVQQELLARSEAEKRLISERNQQIEAEREAALAKRTREEQLHKYLTDAAAAKKAGKADDALWNLRKVLEADPENVQATAHIGLILADSELGNDAEAERMLVKAYDLDPTNAEVLLRLGYVQLRQDKMFDALGSLLQGAKLDPKKAEFRHLAGIACRSLGWPVASETQLKEAFKLDPKNADTAFNLAVLLATLDEPRDDEAHEWYKKALALGAKPDLGLDKHFKER